MKISREDQDIELDRNVDENAREIVNILKEEKLCREENQKSAIELIRETLKRVKLQID